MMRWLLIAACALPGVWILLLLARWWYVERQRQQFDALSWPQQIASLKPDRLLDLPKVQPLTAARQPKLYELRRAGQQF